MITVTTDMTLFNAGLRGLVEATGENMRTVLRKEAGLLVSALVDKSPPRDRTRSLRGIKRSMNIRFDVTNVRKGMNDAPTNGDIKWAFSNEKFLYGYKDDLDMRKASAEEVVRKFATSRTLKRGQSRWLYPFKHARKMQQVSITQNVTILKKTATEALKIIQNKFGRLKASWVVALQDARLPMQGKTIPAWISRHVAKRRDGKGINGLGPGETPFIEIKSKAPGVTSDQMQAIVHQAMAVRIASMKKNAELFRSGVKHLGDYAKGMK